MPDKTDVLVWILILKDRIEVGKKKKKRRERMKGRVGDQADMENDTYSRQ